MNTSTLLILGIAAVGGFLWYRNDALKDPKKPDGRPTASDYEKYSFKDIKAWAQRQTVLRKSKVNT